MPRNPHGPPPPRMLAAGYGVAIAALIINAIVTFWNLSTIRTHWDTYAAGREFSRGINSLLSDLKDAETGQRGFLLTGDDRYLEPYSRSHTGILAEIEQLRSLAGEDSSRQSRLKTVAEASAAKLDELEKTIALRRNDGLDAAIAVVRSGRGRDAMEQIRGELTAMRIEEDAARGLLRDQLETSITRAMVTFTLASAVALALLFGVHLLSERSRQEIRRSASWLSTTLRSIGDAVIATDDQGQVIFMNAVAENLTGWTQGDARGIPLQEIFRITNESTGDSVENPVDKVLREGSASAWPTTLSSLPETDRSARSMTVPPRLEKERAFTGSSSSFATLARPARCRHRFEHSEERYRSLVAATTQTVWLTSPDFSSSVRLNGQDPVGLTDEEKKAGGWLDAIHPEDRERTQEAFDRGVRVEVHLRDGTSGEIPTRRIPSLPRPRGAAPR